MFVHFLEFVQVKNPNGSYCIPSVNSVVPNLCSSIPSACRTQEVSNKSCTQCLLYYDLCRSHVLTNVRTNEKGKWLNLCDLVHQSVHRV